jgi:2-dehydro-3-deoxygluconokinase
VAVPAFEVDIVDRLGAGDAFDAGFIASRLTGEPLAANLHYGAALAALTMTIPSDLALVRPNEVEALLKEAPADIQR